MTGALWMENLLAWSLQALVLIGVGGALPALLRLRHPRTLVTYYQLLLLAALALPAAQHWPREVIRAAPAAVALGRGPVVSIPQARAVGSRWRAEDVVFGVLVAGAAGNLVWLGLGLLRLRRYRRRSPPWIPSAPAWERAEQLVGVRAEARICSEVSGPVMFGARRPVVLLPAEFPAAPEDDQLAIACHELLHVRRRDWGFTLVEELVGAALWFHPA
ncbi:MAG: M56 family metallopeptidase, partial [Bryobacteraceae bacterium]